MIQFIAEDIELPAIAKRKVAAWIKTVAATYNKKCGDIAFVFCNDERILQVNNQYLKHDYYTDIISFDYSTDSTIAGDLFISVDTVKSNSEAFGTDFNHELHRIIIHGVLHLCGNDDKTPELRVDMTAKENVALTLFSF